LFVQTKSFQGEEKMEKLVLLGILVLLIVVLVGGCGSSNTATAPVAPSSVASPSLLPHPGAWIMCRVYTDPGWVRIFGPPPDWCLR
jgi:hypothetical protein